ncbi:MAG: hypothetical protein AAAB36_23195, partial [Ensifer adhaerens]
LVPERTAAVLRQLARQMDDLLPASSSWTGRRHFGSTSSRRNDDDSIHTCVPARSSSCQSNNVMVDSAFHSAENDSWLQREKTDG